MYNGVPFLSATVRRQQPATVDGGYERGTDGVSRIGGAEGPRSHGTSLRTGRHGETAARMEAKKAAAAVGMETQMETDIEVALPMEVVVSIIEMVLGRERDASSTPSPETDGSPTFADIVSAIVPVSAPVAVAGNAARDRSRRGRKDGVPSLKACAVIRRREVRSRVGTMLALASVSLGWRELILGPVTPLAPRWRELSWSISHPRCQSAVEGGGWMAARSRGRRWSPSMAVSRVMRYMIGVTHRQWQPDRMHLARAVTNGLARKVLHPPMFKRFGVDVGAMSGFADACEREAEATAMVGEARKQRALEGGIGGRDCVEPRQRILAEAAQARRRCESRMCVNSRRVRCARSAVGGPRKGGRRRVRSTLPLPFVRDRARGGGGDGPTRAAARERAQPTFDRLTDQQTDSPDRGGGSFGQGRAMAHRGRQPKKLRLTAG